MSHAANSDEVVEARLRRLARSAFRRRFHLARREYQLCVRLGEEDIRVHAAAFIADRLAAAEPVNDGRQTPMRGHPVFIAQHATATCCRHCLQKWHAIAAGKALTKAEQHYVVAVIMRWLQCELQRPLPAEKKPASATSQKKARQLDLF